MKTTKNIPKNMLSNIAPIVKVEQKKTKYNFIILKKILFKVKIYIKIIIKGCNHMTCAKCNHEFCWLCLRDYEGNHFDRDNVNGCPGIIKFFIIIIF